jgi:hypothetical protein
MSKRKLNIGSESPLKKAREAFNEEEVSNRSIFINNKVTNTYVNRNHTWTNLSSI